MKKRILSSLLMGALFVASMSTFTSCKDYDDDINNLQAQIDKAALASDVTTLKTTVDAAASNANSALTKAEAAATQAGANETAIAAVKATADKAATDVATVIASAAKAQTTADASATAAAAAQKTADQAVADAAAAQKDATSALTQLGTLEKTYVTSKALSSALDSVKANINAAVDTVAFNALKKQVASFKGSIDAIYSAVTGVSLVGVYSNNALFNDDLDLKFVTGTTSSKDFTFGKKEIGPKTTTTPAVTVPNSEFVYTGAPQSSYKKNTPISFPTSVVIRVTPTNADITNAAIKLIDSKGNDLNNLLEVESVAKFTTLLTRGTNETGLWTVNLKVKDGISNDKIEQLDPNNAGKHIVYAIAINNTVEKDSSRYAESTYDLTVQKGTAYSKATDLSNVKVKSENSMSSWKLLSACKDRETRTSGALIPATSGENVIVSFENLPNVDKFYIVRDNSYVGESDASEVNAWDSYSYTGLGQIVDVASGTGTKNVTVTIPSTMKTGDEVGFRIFAVNYDGTLVDADGAAFYVYVGADANATSVTGNVTAYSTTPTTEWLPITGTLKDGTVKLFSTASTETAEIEVNGVSYTAAVSYAKNTNGDAPTKNSEIKYVKFAISDNIKGWKDGATGTAQILSKDANQITENTINVSLTKVLPDAAYTKATYKYSWKDGQLVNGVYTAYMYPGAATLTSATWKTAADNVNTSADGFKNMNEAINGLTSGFNIKIANAVYNSDSKKYSDALTVDANTQIMGVDKAVIDNTTEHETTISYNYGKVSSESSEEYVVTVETVKTIFACPLAIAAQKYAWTPYVTGSGTDADPYVNHDVNVLTYGDDTTVGTTTTAGAVTKSNLFDYIKGTNAFDNGIFGKTLTDLVKTNQRYVEIKDVSLVSNTSGIADYFKATVTDGVISFAHVIDGASNPAGDVPSTLKFTLTDAFGHDNVYTLPFTVKRRQ